MATPIKTFSQEMHFVGREPPTTTGKHLVGKVFFDFVAGDIYIYQEDGWTLFLGASPTAALPTVKAELVVIGDDRQEQLQETGVFTPNFGHVSFSPVIPVIRESFGVLVDVPNAEMDNLLPKFPFNYFARLTVSSADGAQYVKWEWSVDTVTDEEPLMIDFSGEAVELERVGTDLQLNDTNQVEYSGEGGGPWFVTLQVGGSYSE